MQFCAIELNLITSGQGSQNPKIILLKRLWFSLSSIHQVGLWKAPNLNQSNLKSISILLLIYFLLLSFSLFSQCFSLQDLNESNSFILVLTISISQSLRMIPRVLQKSQCGPTFFTCAPTQSTRIAFIGEKKLILEKSKSPLILFYFKRENKTRKKTLKK